MSNKNKSAIDYFDTDGLLVEETNEFEGVVLEDYIDKRSSIKPTFVGQYSKSMHIDLPSETEVSFYKTPGTVYAEIEFPNGLKSILFKCRQKKHLTGFITKVIYLATSGPSHLHPDFRTDI